MFFGDDVVNEGPIVEMSRIDPSVSVVVLIGVQNVQSIRSKKESFWNMLEQTEPDIIIASETWLHQGILEREVLPENYRFVAISIGGCVNWST
jgi:hypothetical protein